MNPITSRLVASALLASTGVSGTTAALASPPPTLQTLDLVNPSTARRIPTTVYAAGRRKPLALILNGFGIAPTEYGFIARHLVSRGYAVAAVGLDLPGDAPMASTGDLAVLRRPAWQRGVESVRYAARELYRLGYASRNMRLFLIGHSNGGDVAMLFAHDYPAEASRVLTLDNRRMPFPRSSNPRLCSIRSADHPADPGVLPGPTERGTLRMLIVPVPGLRHDDMYDGAGAEQKSQMLAVVDACLREGSARRSGHARRMQSDKVEAARVP